MNKKIALFYGGSDYEYNGKIISGIQDKCREYRFVLRAFASLLNNAPTWYGEVLSKYVKDGENNIFELADYDEMDYAIILGDHFNDSEIQDKIIKQCEIHNIPAVLIDGKNDYCYNVVYNDNVGMEMLVDHLIKKHGIDRINFISGYFDNRESIERVEAYKKALAENNIPFDERRVDYGWFGGRTDKAMENFMSSELEFPQAIVCANDTMALEAIRFLGDHGLRVPEDVIVTGYDGLMEGQMYYPALTSVRRPLYEAGAKSVEILMNLSKGIEVEHITEMSAIVIENQSCGCKKAKRVDMTGFSNLQVSILNDYKRFNYDIVQFSNDVSKAEDIKSIFKCFFKNSFLFDITNMYFCLNSNILKENNTDIADDNARDDHYTEEVVAYYLDENKEICTEKFPVWQLLPTACPADDDRFSHFYPMYHQDVSLGYVILRVSKLDKNSELFYTLLRTLSNSIGDYCVRSEKDYIVKQLEYLYIRDPMTHLYNRRGLMDGAKRIIDSKNNHKYIVGICIDMDGLKSINDTYGHSEGDNAITQLSKAILFAVSGDEICSRMGGDEFFVFMTCDEDDCAEKFILKINEFLKAYNMSSGKAYKVECSCGVYIAPADKVKSFETVMKFADRDMYKIKYAKKNK